MPLASPLTPGRITSPGSPFEIAAGASEVLRAAAADAAEARRLAQMARHTSELILREAAEARRRFEIGAEERRAAEAEAARCAALDHARFRAAEAARLRPRRDAVQLSPRDPVAVVRVEVLVNVRRQHPLGVRLRVRLCIRPNQVVEVGAAR